MRREGVVWKKAFRDGDGRAKGARWRHDVQVHGGVGRAIGRREEGRRGGIAHYGCGRMEKR